MRSNRPGFLAFTLFTTVTVGQLGCTDGSKSGEVSVKAPLGIEVNVGREGFALKAPGVNVAVNEAGVGVNAPGVDVAVNAQGTTVSAPGVDVNANAQGVTVDAPLGVSVKTGSATAQQPPAQQAPTK